MDQKNLIDISSFLLFEATGDSDADVTTNIHQAKFNDVCMDMAEDDAMSCSYESSYNSCVNEYDGDDFDHGLNGQFGVQNSRYGLSYAETRSDDEDEGVVNQVWRGEKLQQDKKYMAEQQQQKKKTKKKKNVCVEKTMKLISQTEQDRLFWEACLAS